MQPGLSNYELYKIGMNILITGVHGFVGSNLVASLKQASTIFGLDIVSPEKEGVAGTFGWNELDLIPPVDVIIHLAGKAHDTQNNAEEQDYFNINVGLTREIFNYFLQSTATRFIFFSSVKAIADTVNGEYLTEETEPRPLTAYGKSKLEAENYIRKQSAEFAGEPTKDRVVSDVIKRIAEKKVYLLRPCMIHGPGNKGNLNLLYKLVSKGIPWPLGAFDNRRSFTSMGNLQFIIQQLIEKEVAPGIYQVADDEPLSTNKIISLIASSQGKKARIWKINARLINIAASAGDTFHLPLNSERLKKLTESYVVSNGKLKKALGIVKLPVSAEEGMKKTLNSFVNV